MDMKILVVLAAMAVTARAGVVAAPLLAAAPFATSHTAHVVHHSVAAPVASYVAAPAAHVVAAPAAHVVAAPAARFVAAPVAAPARLVAAPFAAPYVGSPVLPSFAAPARLLL
ncbi:hypothetical protein RUM44_004909 [Polyplax serrata]|uniref:Uncharacterized protein n=1 Tax=Polyplax serrata TaxID=468196 RepID=A0ABR1B453_POLSC